ncbi:MalY/PatB family protein [Oceanobacter mangrovi]|uniref:MalY/PatB family protein n=1 Tax=Oceanobacter mangrovi TaxID=2862510 RepID=UPI001FE81B56|nr:MalY/PatB family protein [Oceanobacter mangrovi]
MTASINCAITFDFDQVIPRRDSGCFKWDSNPRASTLPMFVADMDFQTAPAVIEALQQRVEHGVFGYTWIRDEYFEALTSWFQRRYQFAIERDWVLPTIGIVPAISAILASLVKANLKATGVIVQTPVYHCFFSSIRRSGCEVVENPLQLDDQGVYQIDFDDLERKAAEPDNSVLLLCHPHNPSGRVWRNDELQRIGDICLRHQVIVISDEIHCDLLFPGQRHQPFAALPLQYAQDQAQSQTKTSPEQISAWQANCITLHSVSKTFNLAGLQIANIIIADRQLRSRVQQGLLAHEIQGVNPFGVEGLIAACNKGEEWLTALNQYLFGNYQLIEQFLQQHLPQLRLYPQQSTYLAWIDCAATGLNGDQLAKRLLEDGDLRISSGMGFLPDSNQRNSYIRLNFACPRSVLQDGLTRLAKVLG